MRQRIIISTSDKSINVELAWIISVGHLWLLPVTITYDLCLLLIYTYYIKLTSYRYRNIPSSPLSNFSNLYTSSLVSCDWTRQALKSASTTTWSPHPHCHHLKLQQRLKNYLKSQKAHTTSTRYVGSHRQTSRSRDLCCQSYCTKREMDCFTMSVTA